MINEIALTFTPNSLIDITNRFDVYIFIIYIQGRRPRGDWGDGPPQNLRWGTAYALVPPIF